MTEEVLELVFIKNQTNDKELEDFRKKCLENNYQIYDNIAEYKEELNKLNTDKTQESYFKAIDELEKQGIQRKIIGYPQNTTYNKETQEITTLTEEELQQQQQAQEKQKQEIIQQQKISAVMNILNNNILSISEIIQNHQTELTSYLKSKLSTSELKEIKTIIESIKEVFATTNEE